MQAIIETGSKQYLIREGDIIKTEKLPYNQGEQFTFERVLIARDDNTMEVGEPYLKNIAVHAEIIEENRDRKIIVFKMKRRKGYRKKQGHRQTYASVKILRICKEKEGDSN